MTDETEAVSESHAIPEVPPPRAVPIDAPPPHQLVVAIVEATTRLVSDARSLAIALTILMTAINALMVTVANVRTEGRVQVAIDAAAANRSEIRASGAKADALHRQVNSDLDKMLKATAAATESARVETFRATESASAVQAERIRRLEELLAAERAKVRP